MISEDEKQQIRHSVIRAFNNFIFQHYQDLFTEMQEKGNDVHAAIIEERFLQQRATDINSYMQILDLRVRSKPVTKHRMVLVKAAILSLANGDFTLSDLDRGTNRRDLNSDARNDYTDRQMQRLTRERYRHVFFEPNPRQKSSDNRVKQISSVFSESNPSSTLIRDLMQAYPNTGYKTMRVGSGKQMQQVALNSALRLAFPQYLEDVTRFRDECRTVLESLGVRNDRIDFLREQLVENAGLLDVFCSHLTSILDLVWFRTKSKNEREHLLKPCPDVRYDCGDAKKARDMLVDMYGPDAASHILDISGSAFLQYGRLHAAICVFGECANMAENDMNLGVAWQNIAVAHRIGQNFKLALGAMKKALNSFKAAGDAYRICNALQLIGESQWRLGFRTAALKSFEGVEGYGMGMEKDKRWIIQFILGMSFGRLGERLLSQKHLVKTLEMIPEEETERILQINRMIDNEHPTNVDAVLPLALQQELDAVIHGTHEALYGMPGQTAPHQPDAAGANPHHAQDPEGGS